MGLKGIISLNDGQNINIPDIVFDNADIIGFNTNLYHYSNGQQIATKPNLSSYIAECNTRGSMGSFNDIFTMVNYLRQARAASEYESGQAKTYLDHINAHATWILGSIEEGGTFLTKFDNNEYSLMSLQGSYTSDGSNIAYWFASYPASGDDTLSSNELSNGYFVSYDDINSDPYLSFFYLPDGYDMGLYHPAETPSKWEYSVPLSDCLNNSSWETVLPVISKNEIVPVNMFRSIDLQSGTFWNNIKQVGNDSAGVYPQYTKTGGSIWGNSAIDTSSNPYGSTATTGGGNGPWDNNTDSVPPTDSSQFTIDALNSGFYTLYNPDKNAIKAFNNYLFTDITDAMSQVLKRLIANPIDYVVFCAMVHFTPPTSSTGNISFCGLDSGIAAKVVSPQMHHIACGGVNLYNVINGQKVDDTASFLSYNPYYKVMIYLPYIGVQQINVDDVQNGTLFVDYWIDLLTGSCIAQLSVERDSRILNDVPILHSVIAEYTGNCFLNLPMSATDWRGLFSAVMQFAGGAISTASGNASGMGAMASAVIAEKVRPSQSGQLGSNYGYMGKQKPFLFLSRPILQTPRDFEQWEGYPSNILIELGKLTGYTEIDSSTLWINGFDGITESEADMLRSICESGFYL